MAQSFRAWLILSLVAVCPPLAQAAPATHDERDGFPVIMLAELPAEARETLRAIRQGGPFAYDRDGVVFKNYERMLPNQPRGYYREYTVKTPGERNRGVRRIVCSPLPECYYTADHYQTFKRIREQP